ncbi:helix-turn-helix domain-containing protein [Actinomadura macrotermitis]|uniref:HTH cro/C1-type domain-containing protein n=1 Tax=Actinomadura macrotermitis TaxID=2585200 RepID=A0A7K0C3W7_9ACTN|nr:helix-turn-helix transcriptional regulator [Actinomadura macrotermitis]MQY08150.1 hypothetical protein [Actinomadura macrotermitis]
MSDEAELARQAFGERLRNLRKDARLKGRELAELTGLHPTKVSRLEHGRQNPSENDIRVWCIACRAETQIPELIATYRDIALMWEHNRTKLRGGMKRVQAQGTPLYESTKLLRAYESICPPGILQTPGYVRAVMQATADLYELPDDIEEATAARLERQRLLYSGRHRYSFVLEYGALNIIMGGVDTMIEQLDFLESAARLPSVALGIIPANAVRRLWGGEGFYIFDDAMVRTETFIGRIRTVEPQEVAFMARVFRTLQSQAVYGEQARKLIAVRRAELVQLRESS